MGCEPGVNVRSPAREAETSTSGASNRRRSAQLKGKHMTGSWQGYLLSGGCSLAVQLYMSFNISCFNKGDGSTD